LELQLNTLEQTLGLIGEATEFTNTYWNGTVCRIERFFQMDTLITNLNTSRLISTLEAQTEDFELFMHKASEDETHTVAYWMGEATEQKLMHAQEISEIISVYNAQEAYIENLRQQLRDQPPPPTLHADDSPNGPNIDESF
jgi:hypothetical protein